MQAHELAKLIETGVRDLVLRLDRIDERIVSLDGRLADYRNKQVFADLKLANIEKQLMSVVGRIIAVEDLLRAQRTQTVNYRAAGRKRTTARAKPSR